jgi:hypothetical protein
MSTPGRTPAQRLHYLFEDGGTDARERYVSFCTGCSCILKISKTLEPPDATIESLSNYCPGCGSTLETSIATRSMHVTKELCDAPVPEGPKEAQRTKRQFFQSADSLRRFRFGFPPLDNLLEPIDPGWLAVFRGPASGMLAELLCFRAQLPQEKGGMDSTCVFIDGGNCSDPLLFASFAKRARVNPRAALRRVVTSRAFTVYQLANLVLRELPRAINDSGSKLVVVSDALSMFADPSIPENEGRRVVSAVAEGLQNARKRKDALILVTLVTPTKYDSKITDAADLLLELHPDISGISAELVRHPLRKPRLAIFRPQEISSMTPSAHQSMVRAFGKNPTLVQTGTVG